MDWSRKIEPAERRPKEATHITIWLAVLLLIIAALAVAVSMGDSIAFPAG